MTKIFAAALTALSSLWKIPINERRLDLLKSTVQHLYGPSHIEFNTDEAIVLCVIKDGDSLVQAFIEHYLQQGFKHIVFFDNGSTDNTLNIITSYAETTVVTSNKPFSQYYVAFKNYLLQTFGQGKWCLVADVDEFLHFPLGKSLNESLNYLNHYHYDTLSIQMLDMFSQQGISINKSTDNQQTDSESAGTKRKSWSLNQLKATFNGYDISDIEYKRYVRWLQPSVYPALKFLYGGIRKTVFDRNCFLTKEVMTLVTPETRLVSSHLLNKSAPADFTAVFLHYKFTEDFYASTLKAVRDENHWKKSAEYKAYWKVIRENSQPSDGQHNSQHKQFSLWQASSAVLAAIDDLIEKDFLVISENFARFSARVSDHALDRTKTRGTLPAELAEVSE